MTLVPWTRAHPRAVDAAIAAVGAVLTTGAYVTGPHDVGDHYEPNWFGVVLGLATTLPLLWRRRRPLEVLVTVTAAQWTLAFQDADGPGWMAVLIAGYSLGRYRDARKMPWLALAFAASILVFVVIGLLEGRTAWGALVSTVVIFPASVALGDNMRRRTERRIELVERAERAERERELIARERVHDERTRIAREMHDVVAHSVSVMVIQAAAARRQLGADRTLLDETLQSIETTGRRAMDEIRHILGVLRQDVREDDRRPAPSLRTLDELVAADPGLHVTLHTSGTLSGIPNGVELSAYRVVQEALTNVRRHAGSPRTVSVTIANTGHVLDVEIADDGRGASTLAGAADGLGLIGMRERVVAMGGTLHAGPRQGGGWRVHAVFPLPVAGPGPDDPPTDATAAPTPPAVSA